MFSIVLARASLKPSLTPQYSSNPLPMTCHLFVGGHIAIIPVFLEQGTADDDTFYLVDSMFLSHSR